MKIYVVGTGGVGGYFGGLLAKGGKDVTFIARGEHRKALKKNGLTVKSVLGEFVIQPVQVMEHISEISKPDLILFTVKTYDTEKTAEELSSVVTNESIIITFQNGVENDYEIQKFLTNAAVYPGVAYVISTKVAPGVIEQSGGLRKLFFGDRKNPSNTKLKQVGDLMRDAGIDATLSDDITRDIWKKYLFIVAFSGMTGLCRSTIGKVLGDEVTRQLYERCLKEAITVAKAMKIIVAEDVFEVIMKTSHNTATDSKSSLLVDIENHRKNEIETLNGNLVRLAKKFGIDVPINELVYGAIKLSNSK